MGLKITGAASRQAVENFFSADGACPPATDPDSARNALKRLSEYFHIIYPKGPPLEISLILNALTKSLSTCSSGILQLVNNLAAMPILHRQRLHDMQVALGNEFSKVKILGHNFFRVKEEEETDPTRLHYASVTIDQNSPLPVENLQIPSLEQIGAMKDGEEIFVTIPPLNDPANPIKFHPKKLPNAGVDFSAQYKDELNQKIETDVLGTLGVGWGETKVIRDFWQGPLDGHGLTLENTKIKITKQPNGEYLIRISGDGEYDAEKAIKLGGTSKQNDPDSAGKHGEGLKVIALLLLKEGLCSEVTYSSRNWRVDYRFGQFKSGKQGPIRELSEVEDKAGNYTEIKTSDPSFVSRLLSGVNLVYYPGHKDFFNPDFENAEGGFRLEPLDQYGNCYIARQRIQVASNHNSEDEWTGPFKGLNFWTNKDPKPNEYDRDRAPTRFGDLRDYLEKVLSEISTDKAIELIKKLEPFWSNCYSDQFLDSDGYNVKPEYRLIDSLVYILGNSLKEGGVKFSFPAHYVSVERSPWTPVANKVETLKKAGFVACHPVFKELGMMDNSEAASLIQKDLAKVQVNDIDHTKLLIIQKAATLLGLDRINFLDNPKTGDTTIVSLNDGPIDRRSFSTSVLDPFGEKPVNSFVLPVELLRQSLSLEQALGTICKYFYSGGFDRFDLVRPSFFDKLNLGDDEQRQLLDLSLIWDRISTSNGAAP